MRAVKFGLSSPSYVFPEFQNSFRTNFANLVPPTLRLPGLSGGFDELGDSPAPAEIGNIALSFTLVADSRSEMEVKRDQVRQMAAWGVQDLFVQPSDTLLAQRWCRARVNNISMPEDPSGNTDLHQPVSVNFQAADPRWLSTGTESWRWGDGTKWGSGAKWGGLGTVPGIIGTGTLTASNVGNAISRPRILVRCGVGEGVTNVTVERILGGLVVDRVFWPGVLIAGDSLLIDCRRWEVRKNGVEVYSSAFDFLHPDWMRLMPGGNQLRVSFLYPTDVAGVVVRAYDAYY